MRIEVDLPEEAAAEPSPEPFDLPILYEDESMLVIDKPPGVVVHPAAGNPDRCAGDPAFRSGGAENRFVHHEYHGTPSGGDSAEPYCCDAV